MRYAPKTHIANPLASAGMTLIEVMMVLVIAGILAGIGAPYLGQMMNSNRLKSASSMLLIDLNRARNEAIKRNQRILVCARNTDGTDCVATSDWQAGWLVCYDADQNASCDATTANNPNPIVLRSAVHPSLTATAGSANPIRFNPSGSQGAVGAGEVSVVIAGTWENAESRNVRVSASGLVYK